MTMCHEASWNAYYYTFINTKCVWQQAKSKAKLQDYRPVSRTSVVCNLMEHFLITNFMKPAKENNSLRPLQQGFRQSLLRNTASWIPR